MPARPSLSALWAAISAPGGYSEEAYQRLLQEVEDRGIDIYAGDVPDESAKVKVARYTKPLASYTDKDVCYCLREGQKHRSKVSFAYIKNDNALASPLACSQACNMCPAQYRPFAVQRDMPSRGYDRACSDAEAATIINTDIAATEANLAKLRQMIAEHGDTVAKRWQKRTKVKRADLVRAAMPDIYPSKWIEAIGNKESLFDGRVAVTDLTKPLHHQGISPRKCWLLPYLNVESICEKDRLLQLIVARTRCDAEQHLVYDLERTDMAFEHWHVKIVFNANTVVMCHEAGHVGELTPYDAERIHRGDIVGFPRAQLAFEAQRILSSFLSEMVSNLLAPGLCDPPPGFGKLEEIVTVASKTSVNSCSSYSVRAFAEPLPCDFTRLQEALQPLINAAKDDVWLMQTDVMYFRDKLSITEAAARYHKKSESMRNEHRLRGVVEVVDSALLALKVEATAIECLKFIRNCPTMPRGRALSESYKQVFGLLNSVLSGYYSAYQNGLMLLINRTPTFQEHIVLRNGKFDDTLPSIDQYYNKDRLYWSFVQLSHFSGIESCPLDHSFHLHYIEELLCSSKERDRIDQSFYDYFSRMLAINEALSQLKRHLPYGDGAILSSVWTGLLPVGYGLSPGEASCEELHTLLESLVKLPVPTVKVNSENLSRLRSMHDAATLFWDSLLAKWGIWKDLANKPMATVEAPDFMRAFRSAKHITEFQNECRRQQNAIDQAEVSSQTPQVYQVPSQSAAQSVWGTEAASTAPNKAKTKIKSRSQNVKEIVGQLEAVKLNKADETTRPTIPVKCANLNIFTRMYGMCGEAKKDVKWPDLAAAFVDASLSAVHTGGSAVTFRHPTEGSIVFHRPHPDPSVKPVWLRTMGKRLNKWFGWSGETFVERE
ncbi:hypothetical protein LTS10_012194 [Elasticomyces elasticus]|nr:hypothetical protein LTS10_012194 [Elasticomyces elasticus]